MWGEGNKQHLFVRVKMKGLFSWGLVANVNLTLYDSFHPQTCMKNKVVPLFMSCLHFNPIIRSMQSSCLGAIPFSFRWKRWGIVGFAKTFWEVDNIFAHSHINHNPEKVGYKYQWLWLFVIQYQGWMEHGSSWCWDNIIPSTPS